MRLDFTKENTSFNITYPFEISMDDHGIEIMEVCQPVCNITTLIGCYQMIYDDYLYSHQLKSIDRGILE